jgi:hypothetical protein
MKIPGLATKANMRRQDIHGSGCDHAPRKAEARVTPVWFKTLPSRIGPYWRECSA